MSPAVCAQSPPRVRKQCVISQFLRCRTRRRLAGLLASLPATAAADRSVQLAARLGVKAPDRAASKRLVSSRTPCTRYARTGSATPFNRCAPRSSRSKRFEINRFVVSAITTPSGGASVCMRDAIWSVSPTAPEGRVGSPSAPFAPTTTSPLHIPMRVASLSRPGIAFTASITSRAARTARSPTSSCAVGQPK